MKEKMMMHKRNSSYDFYNDIEKIVLGTYS
jgi:hypothetical protein